MTVDMVLRKSCRRQSVIRQIEPLLAATPTLITAFAEDMLVITARPTLQDGKSRGAERNIMRLLVLGSLWRQ